IVQPAGGDRRLVDRDPDLRRRHASPRAGPARAADAVPPGGPARPRRAGPAAGLIIRAAASVLSHRRESRVVGLVLLRGMPPAPDVVVEQDAIVAAMSEPRFYPMPPDTVAHIATHISHVFLAGSF